MCIAIISTAHPDYPLILIDNRDEYVNRPTSLASFWPSHPDVYGARDLLRPIQGTWLGVTKSGKIAVLTNYREGLPIPSAISRGAIIKKFLTEHEGSTKDFVSSMVESGIVKDAGGFSLVCGRIGERLAIMSNRSEPGEPVPWIAGDVVQTVGLSNAAFTNRTWEKVLKGEELTADAIRESVTAGETEDQLVQRFLDVLSTDTLPRSVSLEDGGLGAYISELRKTIFVPPLGRRSKAGLDSDKLRSASTAEETVQIINSESKAELGVDGIYATQKQSIVLVDKQMNVRFFERTLWDGNSNKIELGKGDVDVRFKLEPSAA
jgi:uncharacterized protein with NRDE domain